MSIQSEIARINNEVTTQSGLISQIVTALQGKAAGGSGTSNYVKTLATPASATSFQIENPLGGIAKKVSIRRISEAVTSSRKIRKCVVDWDIKLGALDAVYTSGTVKYGIDGTDANPNNGQFRMTEGLITVYRYNSATTWDANSEYEVEIYQ